MEEKETSSGLTRRDFIKTAGAEALTMGLGPAVIFPGKARAAD